MYVTVVYILKLMDSLEADSVTRSCSSLRCTWTLSGMFQRLGSTFCLLPHDITATMLGGTQARSHFESKVGQLLFLVGQTLNNSTSC